MDTTAIETGIKTKLRNGAIWNSLAQFGQQGTNFILTLILARLLSPEDFGLLGMATVISGFIAYFSEFGLIASIIKKAEVDDKDCNTAFWACGLFSIGTYITIYLAAPLIAEFYHRQELVAITRAVSTGFLISMYGHVPYALEIKKLQYARITLVRLASLLVSGVVAVVLAFLAYGVWALVWQQIVMHFVQALGYLLVFKWIPRMQFSPDRFKELAGFGFHVTINNIVKFASENIDYLIVGKLLGPTALGVYTMSFRLSRYPIEKLWGVFGKMLLPAFAMMQNDADRIKRNVLRVSSRGMIVVMPLLAIILFSTRSYVHLTVGDKWLSTVPLIRMFVVYLAIMCISFSDETVLIVVGKIRVVNTLRLVCSLLVLTFGYLAIQRFNILGMAMSYSIIFMTYFVVMKLVLIRALDWTTQCYFGEIRRSLEYCGAILVAGYVCMQLTSDTTGGLAFGAFGVGCSAIVMLKVHSRKSIKEMICETLPWRYS